MTADRADLLIVGGGIIGATAAWAAARHAPGSRVVLADRGEPGGGASALSAALIVPYAPDDEHRALMTEAVRLLATGPLADFQRTVPMAFVVPGDSAPTVSGHFLGGPLPVAGEDRLAGLAAAYPGLSPLPGETVLDAGDRCTVLDVPGWITAVTGGALPGVPAPEVLTGTTVTRLVRDGDGWAAATAEGPVLRARRVLLATGPWAAPGTVTAPGAHPAPPHTTGAKLVAALHLAPGSVPDGPGVPGVVFLEDDLFVLPGRTPLVSFAARGRLPHGSTPAAGLPAGERAEGVRALARRLPALAGQVTGGRCFPDAYTPGRLPRVGRTDGAPGLAWITGGSGSGVRFAPALAARALRALALPVPPARGTGPGPARPRPSARGTTAAPPVPPAAGTGTALSTALPGATS
ncbi:NAD(P)/FAD-dependent oxidoreductase [Streptomyces genisteinicus]|uniref:FAD-binding oxidoreductase n=1 Tax=Streptomyces genisteinicus TaxID=2768068 RepID=A0A7H0HZH8_9ACTN|nr:FAD-binding oxidoreductase [Streptomyces genisteinicus]QNP65944.1 FAD-binding oxidoreductase [Streptomyces genisteinicus]